MEDVDIQCDMEMLSGGKPRRRAHLLGKFLGIYSGMSLADVQE